ncbi:MAG: VacJ family lipoprotein [Nitrospira sp.]|nr:VacJ family lipoprotein [Nitrospira sp.]
MKNMMAGLYGIPIQLKGTLVGLTLTVALLSFSGCASQVASKALQPPGIEYSNSTAPIVTASSAAAPAIAVDRNSQEEPFDPFARPGETDIEEYDPLEPFNTKVFEFNRQMDRWILKPVAKGYDFILPNPVQIGVSNFFYNTRFVPRLVNNILQGKFRGAGIETGRFLVNTTVGIAGFIDWASDMNLKTPEEDLGQTLGFYGVKPGPYIVVPLYPPFTVRDFVGYVGDIFLNPIYWLALPVIEIGDIPSAIPHYNRTTTSLILFGAKVTDVVNDRSLNLEKYQGVEESTVDLYSAVRNAYLQKRAKAIQE